MDLLTFIPGYTEAIYSTGREPAFVMLVAFLVTFLLARGYTRIARHTGWESVKLGRVHVHHLVFGVILAFTAGALQFALLPYPGPLQLVFAAAFGCGVALVLDEFALVLHLKDVYWEREGRKSIDAVVIATILGLLLLLHITPFASSPDIPRGVLVTIELVNLVFVFIAAFKGKLTLSALGIFIPLLAIIAALRLAEPTSIWAHRFYKPSGKKMRRSVKRYEQYDKVWGPRKEYFWDLLGGKIGRLPKPR